MTPLFLLAACSSDEGEGGAGEGGALDGSGTGEPGADATGSDGAGSGGGGSGGDATSGSCQPGARVCATATASGICLEDGVTIQPIPCPAGQICADGACAPDNGGGGDPGGGVCTAGQVRGCATEGALWRCNVEGTAFVSEPCPDSDPYCNDGVCSDQVCNPGARSCEGRDVVQCNPDGLGETVLETCEGNCNNGSCVEQGDCVFTGKYYIGCNFWAVYLDNEARGLSFGVSVSNPGRRAVAVNVIDSAGTSIYSGSVEARGLLEVNLSTVTQLNGSGLSSAAYRVATDAPVTVHQFNPPNNLVAGYSNDASLLLPSNALGTEYRVMAYHSGDDLATFARLSARWYVTLVAAGSRTTTVSVETPAAIAAGPGVPAIAANSSQSFTLEPGQVLNLQALNNNGDDPDPGDPADMTGMRIVADQPIAVFSGSEASYVPDDTGAADHLEQQLYPVDTWGEEVVLAKFAARGAEPDVYRVMAREAGTRITTIPAVAGVDGRTLANAGDAIEFEYAGDLVVRGSAPISVGQFMVGSMYPGIPTCTRSNTSGCAIPMNPACPFDSDGNGSNDSQKRIGDPAFLLPVASSQFRKDYLFLTPAGYVQNFVSIVHPTGVSMTLDGLPVTQAPQAIAGTTWSVTRVPVEAGTHEVVAAEPIGLSVYGYGCDVSYAYPGGLNLDSAP